MRATCSGPGASRSKYCCRSAARRGAQRVLLADSRCRNRGRLARLSCRPTVSTCQKERERGALLVKAIASQRRTSTPCARRRASGAWCDRCSNALPRVRLLREQPWSDGLALTTEDLCHFELTKNLLFEGTDVRSVCQYDLRNHAPQAIHTALRTHPLVILDGTLRENPFYDGPAILKQEPAAFSSTANAQDVERMLASFR